MRLWSLPFYISNHNVICTYSRPPGHWYSTLRPHNAGAPSATLATGVPACRLQGGHVRPSVWHFAHVLSRRLPSCRRCSWMTTTLRREPNMRRCLDIQQFWWQSLCSCGPHTMEQSSIAPERGGLTVQSILAVAKDIFVWIVGPRRSVNYFNCAA